MNSNFAKNEAEAVCSLCEQVWAQRATCYDTDANATDGAGNRCSAYLSNIYSRQRPFNDSCKMIAPGFVMKSPGNRCGHFDPGSAASADYLITTSDECALAGAALSIEGNITVVGPSSTNPNDYDYRQEIPAGCHMYDRENQGFPELRFNPNLSSKRRDRSDMWPICGTNPSKLDSAPRDLCPCLSRVKQRGCIVF